MSPSPLPLLSLVMIVKDEAKCIRAVLDSVRDTVDRITILDTGSRDGTPDLVRQWMAETGIPGDVIVEDFVDFATTRNRSLDLAEHASVFSLVLSGDEYVDGGARMRSYLEPIRDKDDAKALGVGAYNISILYGGLAFDSPRVVRNSDRWRYVGVVHEVLSGPPGVSPTMFRVPIVTIVHRGADPQRKNDRRYKDLELLHKLHAKDPTDARTAFYLGQTLGELGFCSEGIAIYTRRIALGGWTEEVYESMYRIGQLYERGGKPWAETQQRYLEAFTHSPHRAEPLYAIAIHYYLTGNHILTHLFATQAAAIPYPRTASLFVQPDIYNFSCHDLVAISGFYLGATERAAGAKSAQIAAAARPNDPRVINNLKLYRDAGLVAEDTRAIEMNPVVALSEAASA